MATGMARGAKDRGKRIAFGDGKKIIWDHHSEQVFRGNPNIARPGSEKNADLEWIRFHRGNRIYNHHNRATNKWEWNYEFRPVAGEIFFSHDEQRFAAGIDPCVVVEPNVPAFKTVAPNKQWPRERYAEVARRLKDAGHRVVQLNYDGAALLADVPSIKTKSFREAAAVLSRARLYIGPEGGLHHAAAAVGIPAVVLFGGFIPPTVTGYDTHTNLTGGVEACGSISPCQHCRDAMDGITVDEVLKAAGAYL
jgi:ADP-heptose:LPS heptosyltransferase